MKRCKIKIAVLIAMASFFISCEADLEQLPFDEFATENAFTTAQDFENAIRGAYSGLTRGGFYGGSDQGSMLSAPDVLADNVTLAQSGRFTKRNLHDYLYNPNNTMLTFYNDVYTTVFRTNQILFFAEGFEGESRDNIIAEAKALRALAHLNLVTLFAKIPTQSGDAGSSLGVAYVMQADPNIEPERLSVSETYNLIVEDLEDAKSKINDTNPEGRMGKDAIRILLSRVYLYMGQWQNAVNTANEVATTVASRDSFIDVWEDTNRSGLVFYIPNVDPILGNSIGVTWSQGSMNNLIPEYVVSFDLYNLYTDDDIRKDAYTFQGASGGTQYNGIKKLFGRPGQSNGEVDYKILRAAEAQLNKAEALFNIGNETGARQALDALRSQRYNSPPSGETGTALRDAIRLERRLEFAFEYQRFFDLKRWGLAVNRGNTGDEADGSGTPSNVLNLPANSNRFQLPIAQESLDANPNLTQNPGY